MSCQSQIYTVYWPGIDQDITNLIGSCDVCREVQHTPHMFDKHTTEACYPGHIYGTDIGNIQGKPHVIVVDYFSFFVYERPLPDMTSDTVILALKTIFSEAGVPTILIGDNGRQYCSEEFKEFSLQWSFVHKTASPYYPKGNAHTERAIGVVKEVYTKCGDDFLLVLLVHRATPLLSSNKSPAELFLGCKKVIGVPDSYVIDMDGHHYRRNKRDLTLVPPSTGNKESDIDGDSHQDDWEQPMRTVVRPT